MMMRTVQTGDTAAVASSSMGGSDSHYILMEWAGLLDSGKEAKVSNHAATTAFNAGGSVTPTAGVDCVLVGGATLGGDDPPGGDSNAHITPAVGTTELYDTNQGGFAPTAWVGYRAITNPSGAYTVGGTCNVSAVWCGVTVSVVPFAPVAEFSGTPLLGTAPLTVQFTDLSTNGPVSWSWNFGDGDTSTERHPQHVYDLPGSYTVSLTVTRGIYSDIETKVAYVVVTPQLYVARLNALDLLIKPFTYHRRAAPQFGARFQQGDPDYNSLTFWQHWAQTCWIGGMGQETWQDDSMYDEGVGVDTSLHDRVQLARDLTQNGSTWDLDGKSNAREFCVYNSELYCLQFNNGAGQYDPDADGKLYKYVQLTDTWVLNHTFTGEVLRSMYAWNGELLIGTTANYIHRYNGTTWTTIAIPAGTTQTVYSMCAYRDRLYVGFGRETSGTKTSKIYRLKTDWTWDGSTPFFENPGEGGFAGRMAVHLGYLYMLTNFASILRTDGNNTFEIWNFGTDARAGGLISYDGRLFVTVSQTDDANVSSQSGLYVLSGSAMTQLKVWGRYGRKCHPGYSMALHDGRLYYSASDLFSMQEGFGIAVYDAAEDAHSIFAANSDTTTYTDVENDGTDYWVSGIIVFGGRLWISVARQGVLRTSVSFRDYLLSRSLATYDLTGTQESNGGWLISSTYDGGNAVRKMWRRIVVEAALPSEATTVELDYSLDNGTTWVTTVLEELEHNGIEYVFEVLLTDIYARRFRYRLRLQTTDEDETPVVRSVVVSYMLMPDPQWMWEFIVPVSEREELIDHTTVDVDSEARLAEYRSLFREQRLVTFRDIDGEDWLVLVYGYDEMAPMTHRDIEAEVRFTLLEALEGEV
jgi:PKD repeat protein